MVSASLCKRETGDAAKWKKKDKSRRHDSKQRTVGESFWRRGRGKSPAKELHPKGSTNQMTTRVGHGKKKEGRKRLKPIRMRKRTYSTGKKIHGESGLWLRSSQCEQLEGVMVAVVRR